jgi:hypothetical protein
MACELHRVIDREPALSKWIQQAISLVWWRAVEARTACTL